MSLEKPTHAAGDAPDAGIAVVIGATGRVGSGVTKALLDSGRHVVAVSRSADKLDALAKELEELGVAKRGAKEAETERQAGGGGGVRHMRVAGLDGVVGNFDDEKNAERAFQAIIEAAQGRAIADVVSSQDFGKVLGAPTEWKLAELDDALRSGLYTNFLAAKMLLPYMAKHGGRSFLVVSGGWGHGSPPTPDLAMVALKNAALHSLVKGLAKQYEQSGVRVNTVCVHLSIAPARGERQNQLGQPAEATTLELGAGFLGIMQAGDVADPVVCMDTWETVATWTRKAPGEARGQHKAPSSSEAPRQSHHAQQQQPQPATMAGRA